MYELFLWPTVRKLKRLSANAACVTLSHTTQSFSYENNALLRVVTAPFHLPVLNSWTVMLFFIWRASITVILMTYALKYAS